MFTENDLRELSEFKSLDSVLSIYLNTEPSKGNADAYRLRLRNMLKKLYLSDDVEAVEKYFNHAYDWSGLSIAIFSCQKENFFKAVPLAIPVRDLVHVGDHFSLKPLANMLDNYAGYGVILVDKQGARLFSFHLGELKEQDGFVGEAIKRPKTGGASSMAGRRGGVSDTRGTDETVERNMREIVDFSVKFLEENRVRRLLLSGTDDNVAQFRTMLPKSWQSLVVGTFPINMASTHAEVLEKAMSIGRKAEIEREHRLIETIITAAAKGQGAVVGLEETLKAVNTGRVQTLVVEENLHQSGYRCEDCRTLTINPEENCQGCSGKIEEIEDVIEAAVGAVIRTSGEVEVVPVSSELDKKGGIGAILRY